MTAARAAVWPPSRGWLAIGALFLNALVIQGMAIGGITMFDDRVIAALDTTRGALKFRDLIYISATALSCLAIGWIVERIGVRTTAVLGLLLMSAILAAYGQVGSVGAIYILHAALGFSFASTHVVVLMIVISRWFPPGDPQRGIALGIAIAGASLGAVVLSRVIAIGLAETDWHGVMQGLALLPLILILPTWLLIKPPNASEVDPWRVSLKAGVGSDSNAEPGFSFSAVATVRGLLLMASIIPVFYVSACIASHTVLMVRDRGLSDSASADALAALFLAGLIGKASSGFFLLRLSLTWVWVGFLLAIIAGSTLLVAGPADTFLAAIALCGFGWGGCLPLSNLRIADAYAGRGLARVLGVFVLCESIGSSAGAWLTGVMFDRWSGYQGPLIVNLVLLLAAAAALAVVRTPKASP